MFGSLIACQIKTVYAAAFAGRSALPERLPMFANLAGRESNKKSGTAYRGTDLTTWTLLHLSTKTVSRLCRGYDRAEMPIVFQPTTLDLTTTLEQQPTKEVHNGNGYS